MNVVSDIPQANDLFFYLEIVIVLFVILLQIIHSSKLYNKILNLKSIFESRLTVQTGFISKDKIGSEDNLSEVVYDINPNSINNSTIDEEIIKLSLVHSSGKNETIKRIKDTLNSYLINNYGAAVNFSIIKDIIDREIEIKDDDISQSIPTPLYLGLAATMIGIIFGLLAMPELDGNGFAEGINALINGVKLAMTASLTGLLFTTLLSSYFYKRAKSIVVQAKNDQLSYLQAKLLPELVKAEDTGVSGLKASLDRFAREATKISDNVKIAASQTGMNIKAQLDVITKVENLNMTRISKTNLELFDRLDNNMAAFNQFSSYLSMMQKITENLVEFSKKTESIDIVASEIKSSLNESKDLTRFLTSHLQKIDAAGSVARNAVDFSESYFKEAIGILREKIQNQIQIIDSYSDSAEVRLKENLHKIGESLTVISDNHLNSLLDVYNQSIPKFEQLDNLKLLPELRDKSSVQSKELIESINQLNRSLNGLSNRVDNQQILNKLDLIEKGLKIKRSSPERIAKPKKIGLFKRIKNSFSKKSKTETNEEQ
jgi:ABC-type transporter Mla subunit MlaD